MGNSYRTVVILPLAPFPLCRSLHLHCMVFKWCLLLHILRLPPLCFSCSSSLHLHLHALSIIYFACFRTVLRARFASHTVLRVDLVFPCRFACWLCFLHRFACRSCFLAPFCMSFLFLASSCAFYAVFSCMPPALPGFTVDLFYRLHSHIGQ